MGTAFAATISRFGTLVASPTDAVAAGLIERSLNVKIGFLDWLKFGIPIAIAVVATWIHAAIRHGAECLGMGDRTYRRRAFAGGRHLSHCQHQFNRPTR